MQTRRIGKSTLEVSELGLGCAPMSRLAAAKGATTAQMSLAWLLAKGGDIHPIPGTRRRAYLEENMKAAEIVLPPAEVALLDAAYPMGTGKRARNE